MNMNPFEMMKQMNSIKSRVEQLQKELEAMVIEGSSGAGMVKVISDGKGIIKNVEISEEAMALNDRAALGILITSAMNEVQAKVLDMRNTMGMDIVKEYGVSL